MLSASPPTPPTLTLLGSRLTRAREASEEVWVFHCGVIHLENWQTPSIFNANLPDVPPGPKDVAICPGGEVEVCVGVCPGTTARVYGACVQGCADRCAEAERQRRARALLLQLT